MTQTTLPLIAMTEFPTMPAPWVCTEVELGESWIWGDFFILFEIGAFTVEEMMNLSVGKVNADRNLLYLSSAIVFYRNQLSPHGPSSRPVFAASLERVDYSAAAKNLKRQGKEMPDIFPNSGFGPVMLGVFSSSGRLNFGEYSGAMDIDSMRSVLFERIQNAVPVVGLPKNVYEKS